MLVDTVDGKVVYNVKAGTQTDTRVRLRGKGVPSWRSKGVRGDHYINLIIKTPEKLSREAREALIEFDKLTGDSLNAVARETSKDPDDGKKKKKFGK